MNIIDFHNSRNTQTTAIFILKKGVKVNSNSWKIGSSPWEGETQSTHKLEEGTLLAYRLGLSNNSGHAMVRVNDKGKALDKKKKGATHYYDVPEQYMELSHYTFTVSGSQKVIRIDI